MMQTGDINIEPGKQMPQSLTVRVGEKDAARDVTIRYLLFAPKDYKADGEKWPLLLFLHGLGECSNDDLDLVKIHGPAKIVEGRPDFPFILVTPRCPPPPGIDPKNPMKLRSPDVRPIVRDAWKADELIQLIDYAIKSLNVDPDRVYVTGLSMGGYGTWRLAAKYPDRFAAAIPICGGGDPATMTAGLSKVPIWAFHGAKDPTVPLTESRRMVYHLRQAGSEIRLTVYPDVAHNSWEETYNNPEVYEWLLAHRRNK
jgi:predicted peptidase